MAFADQERRARVLRFNDSRRTEMTDLREARCGREFDGHRRVVCKSLKGMLGAEGFEIPTFRLPNELRTRSRRFGHAGNSP